MNKLMICQSIFDIIIDGQYFSRINTRAYWDILMLISQYIRSLTFIYTKTKGE